MKSVEVFAVVMSLLVASHMYAAQKQTKKKQPTRRPIGISACDFQ